MQLQPHAWGACRPGRRKLRSALSLAFLHGTNPVGASLLASSLRWLKSSRDKLAPTDAIATSCMGCLPAWAEKAAICLVSRISARHKPCRSELARELFAVVEKLARQARSYRGGGSFPGAIGKGLQTLAHNIQKCRHHPPGTLLLQADQGLGQASFTVSDGQGDHP